MSVSKWLEHADPAITLRVYAHFMPEADGRGRRAMNAWFAGSDSEKISPETPQVRNQVADLVPDQVSQLKRLGGSSSLSQSALFAL
ncbi:hypothetical protein ACFU6I_46535 [Streptomyces sp. NPDC057486]|uniref:hypothetical protein n=1 Tax=Streptomyces sp. NPDC057486 TaxID=3346145 RepID=UPI0036967603